MFYPIISALKTAIEAELTPSGHLPDAGAVYVGDYQTLPADGYPAICIRLDNTNIIATPPRAEINMAVSILIYSITDSHDDSLQEVSDMIWSLSGKGLMPLLYGMQLTTADGQRYMTAIGELTIRPQLEISGRYVVEAAVPITIRTWRTI